MGNYGCHGQQILSHYEDDGCPACKKKKKDEEKQQMDAYEAKLVKCGYCGKAKITHLWGRYTIRCDCVETISGAREIKNIPRIIDKWNRAHGMINFS